MKTLTISMISSVCIIAALALPQTLRAQTVPLIHQTTFSNANCPDKPGMPGEHWRTSDYFSGGKRPCAPANGVGAYGGWTVQGFEDRIITAANNPSGGGGKGFRHYRGDGHTGGGGITIQFPRAAEMWSRFYMRYQQGFAWTGGKPNYTKELYVNVGTSAAWVFGMQGGGWGIASGTAYPSSKSWASTMGGATGDGQWHCYEWHIQHGANAQLEIWVDNVQVLNRIANMPAGVTEFMGVGSNQQDVAGAGATPWYTDYDDFAFSTSGRIGCLGLPSAIPSPANLNVQ